MSIGPKITFSFIYQSFFNPLVLFSTVCAVCGTVCAVCSQYLTVCDL
jgi:hypothetical protein